MKRYVKASTEITDDQIKEMISTKVLNLRDKGAEYVIRKILFNPNNNINWQDAYQQALIQMPELELYEV